MALQHLEAWRAIGVEPVGVVARRAASAERFGAAHGLPAFPDLDSLLRNSEVLDICTPTATHPSLVEAAAAAGNDIMCEKPLALTAAEGRSMLSTCRQAGVQLCVAHVLRFFPAYRAARRLVLAGTVGTVTAIRMRRASTVQPGSWFTDRSRSGGLELDLLSHDVDWLLWTFGRPVAAKKIPLSAGRGSGAEQVRLHLSWADGATAEVDGSWNAAGSSTGFTIAGTRGRLEGSTDRLVLYPKDGPALEQVPGSGNPWQEQARQAAAAFRTGADFVVRPEEALAAVEVITEASS